MEQSQTELKIRELIETNTLKTICTGCGTLYPRYGLNPDMDWHFTKIDDGYKLICRYCKKMYTKHNPLRADDVPLSEENFNVGIPKDSLRVVSTFAEVASKFYPFISEAEFRNCDFYPPSLLYKAVKQAKHFVHLLTRSVDSSMLDVLGQTDIQVRGFISSTEGINNLSRLNHYNQGNWQKGLGFFQNIHTKLLVIDGVLAFKGSANLSEYAWRGAFGNYPKDIIEIVIDPLEIARLNNLYFVPTWSNGQSCIKKSNY